MNSHSFKRSSLVRAGRPRDANLSHFSAPISGDVLAPAFHFCNLCYSFVGGLVWFMA